MVFRGAILFLMCFLISCTGIQSTPDANFTPDEKSDDPLQFTNQCDNRLAEKTVLIAEGSLIFLDRTGSPIQELNIISGEMTCSPAMPGKWLELSNNEANRLLLSHANSISSENWIVAGKTMAQVQDIFVGLCLKYDLGTVFAVNETRTSVITGCQVSPDARQAVMIEFILDDSQISITMMWPKGLENSARKIAQAFENEKD